MPLLYYRKQSNCIFEQWFWQAIKRGNLPFYLLQAQKKPTHF
jgi:hypothetical protein